MVRTQGNRPKALRKLSNFAMVRRMLFTTVPSQNEAHVYLDHNATTPLSAELVPKVTEWLTAWGNPSSIHWAGRKPKTLMRDARRNIANLLGCDPLEIVFTSGGSEANNLALKGVFEAFHKPSDLRGEFRNHYLISAVEHPSVRRTADFLSDKGAEVEFIPVLRSGCIDMEAYARLLRPTTALVSVMFANNETGNVFPVAKMSRMAHDKGALFHTDAVQALGKIPFNLSKMGVDLASFAGHKFYSLKGSGVLFVRRGVRIESLIHGGGQERHRRGGTENLLAICSLGAMAEKINEIADRAAFMRGLRDSFEKRVLSEIAGVTVTGGEGDRLPNTSSLVIHGVDGETLLMNLDLRGYAVSTGAACSSGSPEPSPVLLAMGLSRQEAQNSLRVGIGWSTTETQVENFIEVLKEVVTHIRSFAGTTSEVQHV
jgi:cysteine desulfurase